MSSQNELAQCQKWQRGSCRCPGEEAGVQDPCLQMPQSFHQSGTPEVRLPSSLRLTILFLLLPPSFLKSFSGQASVFCATQSSLMGSFHKQTGFTSSLPSTGKVFHSPSSCPGADPCLVLALGLTSALWESNEFTSTSGNRPSRKTVQLFPEGSASFISFRKGKVRIGHSVRWDCIIWGKTGKRD